MFIIFTQHVSCFSGLEVSIAVLICFCDGRMDGQTGRVEIMPNYSAVQKLAFFDTSVKKWVSLVDEKFENCNETHLLMIEMA